MNNNKFSNRNEILTPFALSPEEAARFIGVGRTTLYAALGKGELRSSKIGKRRVITVEALKEWIANNEVPNALKEGV